MKELLDMLEEVLSVTELNLDDMEPETREIVRRVSARVADLREEVTPHE